MTALDFIAETRAAIAAITDSKITTAAVDINNCDREPIHIPAAIQPHGLLLVMREADWQIVQASQNVSDYLGRSLDAVLHQPLSEILTATQIQALEQCLAKEFETVNPLRFEIWVGEEIRTFSAVAHRTEAAVILELELVADQEVVSFFDFYRLVKRPVSQIQQTQTLEELCQSAVETVAQISGFDRVMIYQFDEDGSGSVIAEAKRDDLTPYLGLHYPPTDIPKQAKYLYLLNLLRLIPDVDYEPVPLVPDRNPLTGRPLDMSLSSLRSVSPLHTEYLTNMGVQATMAISLVHNRQLWGMVVCHHGSPRQVSQELRTVCEFLG
ncbi:MAG: GAF domain-containing protein [Leptolyngbyaceae cyanobacterium]